MILKGISENYILKLCIVIPCILAKQRIKNSIVNKRILNEIKEKVKESSLLYGGRERSEAERSDAPIK